MAIRTARSYPGDFDVHVDTQCTAATRAEYEVVELRAAGATATSESRDYQVRKRDRDTVLHDSGAGIYAYG